MTKRKTVIGGSDSSHCSPAARFIAFSGGVESTTMVAMFHKMAQPVFTDTGWEHDELYKQIEKVEKHFGIEVIRVKRKDGLTLPQYIADAKFYPGFRARFCTRMFKIEPMDEFLADKTPCEIMIGLNAEEAEKRTGNFGLQEGMTYSYPLVDLGVTRGACVLLLKELGILPQFPEYMKRGGCVGCFYKSKREYAAMAKQSPAEADSIADLEELIQDERGKYYAVRDGIANMRKFIEQARSQMEFAFAQTDDLVVPEACGVFCRR